MRESYTEGLAIHGGPESCAVVREGAGEALTGVCLGQAIEPRNQESRAPTWLSNTEGNMGTRAFGERVSSPAGSKNLCMSRNSMRENREIQEPPCTMRVLRAASGRPEASSR